MKYDGIAKFGAESYAVPARGNHKNAACSDKEIPVVFRIKSLE